MHKKLQVLFPVLFVLLFAGNLYAQEGFIQDVKPAYLQQLIDTAKKRYPEVKVKATQTAIATTTWHQAQISWFDIITPSYIYNPQNSLNVVTPSVFNGYQIAVTVNLGSLIAKPYIIRNARQAVTVAKLQQDEYNLTIEAQVKRLYYTYLEAQAELRLRIKSVQDAKSNETQLKYQYQKNEKTLSEYSAAQNLTSTQAAYEIQGELAVFNAKVSLEEIVGKRLEDIR